MSNNEYYAMTSPELLFLLAYFVSDRPHIRYGIDSNGSCVFKFVRKKAISNVLDRSPRETQLEVLNQTETSRWWLVLWAESKSKRHCRSWSSTKS